MQRKKTLLVVVVILALILATFIGVFYYEQRAILSGNQPHTDTFFPSCHITGTGGIEVRVISDSSGVPVQIAPVSGVLRTECDTATAASTGGYVTTTETQVIYVNNFTEGQGGWETPVLPNGAQSAGIFNFSIHYEGKTYGFAAYIPPASITCVTLRVPSGNVTSPVYRYQSSCPP